MGTLETLRPWLEFRSHEIVHTVRRHCLMPGGIDPHPHPSMAAVLLPCSSRRWVGWEFPREDIETRHYEEQFLTRLVDIDADLPARPIFSADSAAAAIERSTMATGQAVNQFTESGRTGGAECRHAAVQDLPGNRRHPPHHPPGQWTLYLRRFAATARVMGENLIRWLTCSPARIGRGHQASRSLGRSDIPNGI